MRSATSYFLLLTSNFSLLTCSFHGKWFILLSLLDGAREGGDLSLKDDAKGALTGLAVARIVDQLV